MPQPPAAERPQPALPWADADRARIGPAPGDPGWLKPSATRRRWMAVLWPSFLGAAVLELLVFAFADPAELQALPSIPEAMSREFFYTSAFFAFWLVCGLACALTARLVQNDSLQET